MLSSALILMDPFNIVIQLDTFSIEHSLLLCSVCFGINTNRLLSNFSITEVHVFMASLEYHKG